MLPVVGCGHMSPKEWKAVQRRLRRHADGGACPELHISHSQAGTEMGTAVSVMNIEVFVRVRLSDRDKPHSSL